MSERHPEMEGILGPNVSWTTCRDEQLPELTELLRRAAPSGSINLRVVAGEYAVLPVYRRCQLFDLQIEGASEVDRVFVIVDDRGSLRWLDGKSTPVHDLNDAQSLHLESHEVLDYLRWFLFAVRGDAGAFVLLDSPESLSEGTSNRQRLAEVRATLVPFELVGRGSDGRFEVQASIAYEGAIFTARFGLETSGLVEMLDDVPVGQVEDLVAPEYPPLALVRSAGAVEPAADLTDGQVRSTGLTNGDVDVTKAVVSVLLGAAVRAQLGDRLLQRFNTQAGAAAWESQLLRYVQESTPIIVIESDIPFAEDIVAGLLDPQGQTFPPQTIQRAEAVQGDDTRCAVALQYSSAKLHLISFHAYRSLWDTERTAHELAIGTATVLIGCERVADVPEPLRRVTDLRLTLPRIDPPVFAEMFQRVFQAPPPVDWDAGSDRGGWTRYLLHSDFHAPLRLGLTPLEAVDYLHERCAARLREVSADDSPSLNDLHGLGEARQIAEDLIADIAAARAEIIPWSAVDHGLLLVGVPGTGKTTLARAIARECDVKFIQGSAAQWQSAGSLDAHLKALRDTFAEARRYAPAILFIDEIDSIGNRELLSGHNAVYQTDVINALLEQIQGMDPNEPVVVIGATNFAERVDPALRRAGRLDQVVTILRPNVAALTAIFEHYLRPHRVDGAMDRDVDTKLLAQLAFGATGADVEFFVRGAARRARKERRKLAQADLVAEVTRRPRRDENVIRLTPDELRRVAVHEAGHALVSLVGSGAGADIAYVSVIPRMDGSLGFVASAPEQGASITRRQCIERLEVALGGRAAEELVYGEEEVSLGAGGDISSDLAAATRIATSLVCTSGLGGDGSLLWTDQPTVDQLVQIDALLRQAYRSAIQKLALHRSTLDDIAKVLVAEQELDGDALRALLP